MSDQKIEIEISTKATGAGVQQTIAGIQDLRAEAIAAAQSAQDSAVPKSKDDAQSTGKPGGPAGNALASAPPLNQTTAGLPPGLKTSADAATADPAQKWSPSEINALAEALERIAAASGIAAENAAKIQANLEAVGRQYTLLDRPGNEVTQPPGLEVQSRLTTPPQGATPPPMSDGRDSGPSPEVRALIERAQAETVAVGKAWAEGMIQLRAYVESQTSALSARQQNQIQ